MYKKFTILLTLGLLVLSLGGCNKLSDKNQIYISTNGLDTNKGTMNSPLATLEGAKAKIQEIKKDNKDITPKGGVEVLIAGGTYNLDKPFTLRERDSGDETSPISYKALNDEPVIFTAAKQIKGANFAAVTDKAILKRLPKAIAQKVVEVDLVSEGITEFGGIGRINVYNQDKPDSAALYVDGVKQRIARWPNEGYITTGNVLNTGKEIGGQFEYSDLNIDRFKNANQLKIHGYFYWDWQDDSLSVTAVDTDKKTISVEETTVYGMAKGRRYYFYNLLEEIDEPGEWFLDRDTGKMYLYPTCDLKDATIQFASMDKTMVSLNDLNNVSFTGITFEATPHVAMDIKNCSNVLINSNTFRNIGGRAVTLSGGNNCNIAGNDFYNIGKGAIYVNSVGDRKNLVKSNHIIENNYMTRFNTVLKTYSPAVYMTLETIGVTIRNNVIHDSPHTGIMFNGNEHTIENNEFFDLCLETNDAGAVYSGRDFTSRGNKVNNNIFHDIRGLAGSGAHSIYFDDSSSGAEIKNNLFFNINTPVFIHGGREFKVDSNIVANSTKSVTLVPLSGGENCPLLKEPDGGLWLHYQNVPATSEIWKKAYPTVATVWEDKPYLPLYNEFTRTLNYKTGSNIDIPQTAKATGKFENNIQTEDNSLFENAAKNNFKLVKDAGIKGFVGIDIKTVGLKIDENRRKIPEVRGFELQYPTNNQAEVFAHKLLLKWEKAAGGAIYNIIVADNKEMKNPIFKATTRENCIVFDKAEYSEKTYYWTVNSTRTSILYPSTTANLGGVYSFTTMKTEIVDSTLLVLEIENAKKVRVAAMIGNETGEFKIEVANNLDAAIKEAESSLIVEKTQVGIDKAVDSMKKAKKVFYDSKNVGVADFIYGIKDRSSWIAENPNFLTSLEDGKGLMFKPSHINEYSSAGFSENIPNSTILKFKARLDGFEKEGSWMGISLRSASQTMAPWAVDNYMFGISPTGLSVERYGANGNMKAAYGTLNNLFKVGEIFTIEISATDVEGGVNLRLVINDNVVIDKIDKDGYIGDEGCFALFVQNNCSFSMWGLE